jgi:D-3-phosphoglycerate dehydrogenase / 2-oxoglutarate reductase
MGMSVVYYDVFPIMVSHIIPIPDPDF